MTQELTQEPLMVKVGELVTQRIKDLPTSKTVVPKSIRRTLMAGFAVEQDEMEPKDAQRIVNETNQKAGRFTSDRAQFDGALEQIGASYKTILPVKLFNQLCKEFGLIRFETFTQSGDVYISRTKDEIRKKFGYTSFLPLSIVSAAIFTGLIGYVVFGLSWPTFVAVIAGAGIAAVINYKVIEAFGKNPKFISWLFGEVSIERSDCMKIQPIFPELPEELKPVMKTLIPLSAKGKLFTAALPEAVKVDTLHIMKNMDGVIEEELKHRTEADNEKARLMDEARKERWRKFLASLNEEPITYSKNEKGNLIAVHFQFGDFPREKEFMERIENITDYELFSYID